MWRCRAIRVDYTCRVIILVAEIQHVQPTMTSVLQNNPPLPPSAVLLANASLLPIATVISAADDKSPHLQLPHDARVLVYRGE